MLEPDGRAALTEQLRPPSGFQLAHAVATTFTLDLTTALSVPLAFAAHRVRESRDPIAILDAVRRAADKIDVFAQAGQVFEPRVASDLFALLEPMIHPARAPRPNMLFHPKVWVLEYADGDARSYRMLCASRNLTNDRSWDLVVRLDGIATDEPTEQSAPLGAFVRALPAMSVQPLPARSRRANQRTRGCSGDGRVGTSKRRAVFAISPLRDPWDHAGAAARTLRRHAPRDDLAVLQRRGHPSDHSAAIRISSSSSPAGSNSTGSTARRSSASRPSFSTMPPTTMTRARRDSRIRIDVR